MVDYDWILPIQTKLILSVYVDVEIRERFIGQYNEVSYSESNTCANGKW
jgi:hypothetical protein